MKQNITIRTATERATFTVKAQVETNYRLTRAEAVQLRDAWADRLMQTLQSLPLASAPLSRIKVGR